MRVILSKPNFSLIYLVLPTGTVDLISMIALDLIFITCLITSSTADVSK